MPCLIALVVLAVMSIFSARYRKLTREAFDCVFRRVTLRPCNTGFDVKVRTAIVAKILTKSPKAAKVVNQKFELIAWVFVLVFTLSFLWTVRGIYNFWAWGDCNGRYQSGGFCAFDPTGENSKISEEGAECKDVGVASRNISIAGFDKSLFPTMLTATTPEVNSAYTSGVNKLPEVIMFGCYACDYTRKAYPLIKKLIAEKPVDFTFIHFPTKHQTDYLLPYDYCIYQQKPEAYWPYVDMMFSSTKEQVADEAYVRGQLLTLGIGMEKLDACLTDETAPAAVNKQMGQSLSTGIYGTPTIYINGTPVIGPKPERVYRRLLN